MVGDSMLPFMRKSSVLRILHTPSCFVYTTFDSTCSLSQGGQIVTDPKPQFLKSGVAYLHIVGNNPKTPGIFWLGGLCSTMRGTKATALAQWAQKAQYPFVRFDYRGHGESQGFFEHYTLSHWREDAQNVLTTLTHKKQILVGSSMGGWLALLLARDFPERIHGLILIAPSVNFTKRLFDSLSPTSQNQLQTQGKISLNTEDGPLILTCKLFEDAKKHFLNFSKNLSKNPSKNLLSLECPVRIFHGLQDTAVFWQESVDLLRFFGGPARLTLSNHSDHSFSGPQDIEQILQATQDLVSIDPLQKTKV